jgi:hypothetical protein
VGLFHVPTGKLPDCRHIALENGRVRFRLIERGLKRWVIDLGEQVALVDVLAFLKAIFTI